MSRSVNERSGSRPRVAESNVTRETPNACAAGHCWASHCWKAALAAKDGAANNNIVISPRKNRIPIVPGFTSEIHVPESWQRKDRHGRKKPGHDDITVRTSCTSADAGSRNRCQVAASCRLRNPGSFLQTTPRGCHPRTTEYAWQCGPKTSDRG